MKIIAILNQADTVEACLDGAARAAFAIPSATIEALHIIVDPEHIIAASEEIEFQRMREAREGTASEKAAAIKAAFDDWLPNHLELAARWRTVVASEEEGLVRAASDADLLVMARNRDMDTGDAFHATVIRMEKPLILVPHRGLKKHDEHGGFATVAIGLADTSAEHHALSAAHPWLAAAQRIVAIRIGNEEGGASRTDSGLEDFAIEQHFADRNTDLDIGAQIASEADSVDADLLVCGAYRHNQLIEWLLGGTTRHLLDAATIPVLISR